MKSTDKYFTVEKILDKKRVGHITKYLIKWDGYSEQDNTWVFDFKLGTFIKFITH